MKKIVGVNLSRLFYHIGNIACKIGFMKDSNGVFCADKYGGKRPFYRLMFEIYNNSMSRSLKFQRWCGADEPWRKPTEDA